MFLCAFNDIPYHVHFGEYSRTHVLARLPRLTDIHLTVLHGLARLAHIHLAVLSGRTRQTCKRQVRVLAKHFFMRTHASQRK